MEVIVEDLASLICKEVLPHHEDLPTRQGGGDERSPPLRGSLEVVLRGHHVILVVTDRAIKKRVRVDDPNAVRHQVVGVLLHLPVVLPIQPVGLGDSAGDNGQRPDTMMSSQRNNLPERGFHLGQLLDGPVLRFANLLFSLFNPGRHKVPRVALIPIRAMDVVPRPTDENIQPVRVVDPQEILHDLSEESEVLAPFHHDVDFRHARVMRQSIPKWTLECHLVKGTTALVRAQGERGVADDENLGLHRRMWRNALKSRGVKTPQELYHVRVERSV